MKHTAWTACALALLTTSCGEVRDKGQTRVSLQGIPAKLGSEIDLVVENAPPGWSGQVNVDNNRYFPIDGQHHAIRVTTKNGFIASQPNELFIMLFDRSGREIPLEQHGRLGLTVNPADPKIRPDSANAEPVKFSSPVAKISLDAATVKMGSEIAVRIDQIPGDWSGQVVVNTLRIFPVQSRIYRLKTSRENGFNPEGPTDLYFLLTDSKGRQIRLPNGGHFRIIVIPEDVTLARDGRNVGAEGEPGSIVVKAKNGYNWSVGGMPSWITIGPGVTGSGNGVVAYRVSENTTNAARSATLTVGDATYDISQARPESIQIPFREAFDFPAPPPPIWTLLPKGASSPVEAPNRWTWDEQPGQRSLLTITTEAPSGHSLVVDRAEGDSRAWATQLILPHIRTRPGMEYKLSAWMKAEYPAPVSVSFGQGAPPYASCGLGYSVRVTNAWSEFSVRFRASAERCDSTNNRLTIQVGRIRGKLRLANLALVGIR